MIPDDYIAPALMTFLGRAALDKKVMQRRAGLLAARIARVRLRGEERAAAEAEILDFQGASVDEVDAAFLLSKVLGWSHVRPCGLAESQVKSLWRAVKRQKIRRADVRQRQELRLAMRWLATELYRFWVSEDRGVLRAHRRDVAAISQSAKGANQRGGFNRKVEESISRVTNGRKVAVARRMKNTASLGQGVDWISPGICFEHRLRGAIGGGDWFNTIAVPEVTMELSPDWPDVRANSAFQSAFPFFWQPPTSGGTRKWPRVALNEWLGAAEISILADTGRWPSLNEPVSKMIGAIVEGGVFVCRGSRPSPKGGMWVKTFFHAIEEINQVAAEVDPKARFMAWCDPAHAMLAPPSRWENLEDQDAGFQDERIEVAEAARRSFLAEVRAGVPVKEAAKVPLKKGIPASIVETWV